jgi:benzoyl-CoA reductase/2-hydroxyglutaryl-CoA dehydratase subunit BcrC/BadD/HgdB
MKKIGMTSTAPMEIIYAAGMVPVDLNNIFITSSERQQSIEAAEMDGYPRNACSWIKGLYGMVTHFAAVDQVVAIMEGDCSQTHALMETLEEKGIGVIPFSFPFARERRQLLFQLQSLSERLGADWQEVLRQKQRLDQLRRPIWEIDRLTWQENKVGGFENHYWQISCSDFCGQPEAFAKQAEDFIKEAKERQSFGKRPRIGVIGVPTIIDDLYEYLEELGAQIVFNEVQRQFSMPYAEKDIVDQYRLYTYPYHVKYRIEDILQQIRLRRIDAIIHYTQSFCFRQIEDILFRNHLPLPLLSLEGDQPGVLDARNRMRVETFINMLGVS